MRLSRGKKVVVVVGAIVLIGFGGRIYLSSEAFIKVLEQQLSDTGYQVQIDGTLAWKSIYPQIQLSAPALTLLHDTQSDAHYRIRAKNVDLSLPMGLLLSSDTETLVNINVRVARLGVIVTHKESHTFDSTKSAGINLSNVVQNIQFLRGDIRLDQAEIVWRGNSKNSNVRLRSANLTLREQLTTFSALVSRDEKPFIPIMIETVYEALEEKENTVHLTMTLSPQRDSPKNQYDIQIASTIQLTQDTISTKDFVARYAKNQVNATLTYIPTKNSIEGEIGFRRLEFLDFLSTSERSSYKLFSDTLINYASLANIAANLKLKFGAVRYDGVPVINGTANFNSTKGKASFSSGNLQVLSGKGSFDWRAKQLGRKPQFSLYISVDNVDLSRINTFLGDTELFLDGHGALRVTVSYSGNSFAKHAKLASGTITLGATNSVLAPTFLIWADQSLVSYGKFATSKQFQEPKELHLPCARAHFALDQGFLGASKSIVAETTDNIIVSSGYADLDSEQLSFTFSSRTKKTIDWSLLSQVKYVQLGGIIKEPKLTINQKEAAKKGALLASSFIFGPIPSLAYSAIEAAGKHGEEKPRCTSI